MRAAAEAGASSGLPPGVGGRGAPSLPESLALWPPGPIRTSLGCPGPQAAGAGGYHVLSPAPRCPSLETTGRELQEGHRPCWARSPFTCPPSPQAASSLGPSRNVQGLRTRQGSGRAQGRAAAFTKACPAPHGSQGTRPARQHWPWAGPAAAFAKACPAGSTT